MAVSALDDWITMFVVGSFVYIGWEPQALPAHRMIDVSDAYSGSLDAAKALHDSLLPGWDMQINAYEDDSFDASVSQPLQVKTYDGVSPWMARAWLLAVLRAYRETQP